MSKDQITEEVLSFVNTLVQNNIEDELTPQSLILSEQYVDSLGIIQLVSFIESKFNIKMGQEDLNFDNLDSVERIVSYVVSKQS